MTNEGHRADVVQYWWAKAERSLASAGRELEAEEFSFAMNRVYYAAFYAVSAALLERHSPFKKHSGIRSAFHREFIKTGLLDIQWAKFYDQLFEDRQEGDYVASIAFEREYVERQMERCAEFLAQLRPLVSSLKRS